MFQKNPEYILYEEHPLSEFPKNTNAFEHTINNVIYVLTRIPEAGLYETYFGQGDLTWAWVRKDIFKTWAMKFFG